MLVQAGYEGKYRQMKGGTLRFIISKKADICFINRLRHRAGVYSVHETPPESRQMTIFTDEPLEKRRKLDVVLRVSVAGSDIAVKMTAPVASDIVLRRELVDSGNGKFSRFCFDLDLDGRLEGFLEHVEAPMLSDENENEDEDSDELVATA